MQYTHIKDGKRVAETGLEWCEGKLQAIKKGYVHDTTWWVNQAFSELGFDEYLFEAERLSQVDWYWKEIADAPNYNDLIMVSYNQRTFEDVVYSVCLFYDPNGDTHTIFVYTRKAGSSLIVVGNYDSLTELLDATFETFRSFWRKTNG
jgi:hypothetical protein